MCEKSRLYVHSRRGGRREREKNESKALEDNWKRFLKVLPLLSTFHCWRRNRLAIKSNLLLYQSSFSFFYFLFFDFFTFIFIFFPLLPCLTIRKMKRKEKKLCGEVYALVIILNVMWNWTLNHLRIDSCLWIIFYDTNGEFSLTLNLEHTQKTRKILIDQVRGWKLNRLTKENFYFSLIDCNICLNI